MKPTLLITILTVAVAFCGCKKKEPEPGLVVKPADMIGKWKIDEEATKSEMGLNVLERAGLAMYKDMELEFTAHSIKIKLSMLGQTKELEGRYKVVQAEQNIVKVEATSGPEVGKVSTVEFLSKDQMRFARQDEKGSASSLVLARVR